MAKGNRRTFWKCQNILFRHVLNKMFHLVVDKKRRKRIGSKSPKQNLPTFVLRWHLHVRIQTTKAQKLFSIVNNVQAPMGVSLVEVKMFQRESKYFLIFIFLPCITCRKKKKSVLAEPESRTCVFMLAAK